MRTRREKRRAVLSLFGGLAAVCCALAIFFGAMGNLNADSGEQSRRQLEETLRRAAVACYAAQGAYPPDLSYIEEHWGVQIDRSRYAVFYQVEGSNLMPDITVLERETGESKTQNCICPLCCPWGCLPCSRSVCCPSC